MSGRYLQWLSLHGFICTSGKAVANIYHNTVFCLPLILKLAIYFYNKELLIFFLNSFRNCKKYIIKNEKILSYF